MLVIPAKAGIQNKASRNPGSAGILPALLNKVSHSYDFFSYATVGSVRVLLGAMWKTRINKDRLQRETKNQGCG